MSLATVRTNVLESAVHALDALPARHQPATPQHLQTGREGELAAFFYLRKQGYTVVARGWKSPRAPGDIDLIAWDDETLCFVEVKTRTTHDVATAESAIDEHKRRTLRKLAGYYVRNLPDGTPARFDVVTVYLEAGEDGGSKATPQIELFRNAFGWMDPINRFGD